jgi:secretory phospholipase A2
MKIHNQSLNFRCGPGDIASDYDDLGPDAQVDKCCRSHDHCDNIAAGEEKYGLKNNDIFTILRCNCDDEFRECLHHINSPSSNLIGNIYFNARKTCYDERFPVISCLKKQNKKILR